ncbi:MAG TPA: histidine kinase, partial [Cyanobacteria bacterium UBA12227]|nr:histidine kinase [Cyanobacteria bacterium UBA12227]
MITGQGDEAIAVQAIKNGAQDYLVKSNLTSAMLCRATKTIVQQTHLQGLLEQSQERQRLISAIALRIRQSLNLNEILNTTVTEVRQFLTCDRVVVYQFAPDMSGDIVAESVAPGWTPALGTTIQDTCFQTGAGENYRQGRKRAIDNIYEAELT